MPIYIDYDGIKGTVREQASGGHRGEIEIESFSWGVSNSGAHARYEVKLEDLLVSSYQSGGHAGAAVQPDLLAGPVVIDTCGGGDGSAPSMHFAMHDDPF
jgi:type VI protein secretion system component Hcp